MKLMNWILSLYPRAWRARYQEEMLGVLEQHTITVATLLDLLLGALDARLDPHYRTEGTFALFKNAYTTSITLSVALAIFAWVNCTWHMIYLIPPLEIGSQGSITEADGDSFTIIALISLLGILFVTGILLKEAIVARRIGSILLFLLGLIFALGTALFAFQTFSYTLLVAGKVRYTFTINDAIATAIYRFIYTFLTACSVYVALVTLREAVRMRGKGILWLAALFYVILPLSAAVFLASFYTQAGYFPKLVKEWWYFPWLVENPLLLFSCPGALLMMAASREIHRRHLWIGLIVAILLTPALLTNTFTTILTGLALGRRVGFGLFVSLHVISEPGELPFLITALHMASLLAASVLLLLAIVRGIVLLLSASRRPIGNG